METASILRMLPSNKLRSAFSPEDPSLLVRLFPSGTCVSICSPILEAHSTIATVAASRFFVTNCLQFN